MKWLDVDSVSLCYDENVVLDKVSMSLNKGEIACLIGPSGCGKTSLLRSIAGFEDIFEGKIYLGNKTLSKYNYTHPPESRGVGIVFQDFALFPHLTAYENVVFGLTRLSRKEKKLKADYLLDLVGLSSDRYKYPGELSGGQQQRVALARALAPEPELLLMDEPFSQLDPDLRTQLLENLQIVLKQTNTTAVVVTHQQDDAFVLADKLGVLHNQKMLQWANPYEVYHEPNSPFVADFIGRGKFLTATFEGDCCYQTELGKLCGEAPAGVKHGDKVRILVRPDDVIHDDESPVKAKVLSRVFKGAYYMYELELKSHQHVLALVQSHHNHPVGEKIGIRVEMDHVVCFPELDF